MAMIPQFQGGVPQVQDTGNAGISPAQLPQPTFDYAKVMETAMKPLHDFANSFTKTMEVERARMIKAESDDAERQVIELMNNAMMGENGYLTQQGKNAVDSYEKSMEGIRAGVDSVMDNLSPQAREAIQSRVQDRVLSTVTQANRHKFAQSQQWQVNSSKTRIDSLVDDYSLHFGDAEYQKKTWASISSEIDYVANLQGYDAEQTKALKAQTYSLVQAKMYSQWMAKDPVAAFAGFKMNQDSMDPDVALKLDAQMFSQSRDLLSLSLASSLKEGETGKVSAEWIDNPLAKTGNAFIDSLPDDQRFQITTRAKALFSSDRAQAKQDLTLNTENSLTEVRETGQATQLTIDQFVAVYGVKEGTAKYNTYADDFFMNKSLFDMRNMPQAEMSTLLESARPKRGDDDFAAKQKRYEILRKASSQISKARKDDPVGYALANGVGGYAPLAFDNVQAMTQQLRIRQVSADDIAKDYGSAQVLLSKSEAQMLTTHLDGLAAKDQAAYLTTIYNAVGVDGAPLLVDQLKSGKTNYAIAMAGMGSVDKSGISLGTKYLIGQEAIANKQVTIDSAAELGTVPSIRKLLDTEYDSDPEDTVEGVFTSRQAMDATVSLATGVYAYNALAGKYSVDDAVEQSVGEIYNRNNKKVILPRGMDDDDFEDQVAQISRGFKDPVYLVGYGAVTPKDIPALFAESQLQTERLTEDGVAYSLVYLGVPVVDKQGKKVFIEVK